MKTVSLVIKEERIIQKRGNKHVVATAIKKMCKSVEVTAFLILYLFGNIPSAYSCLTFFEILFNKNELAIKMPPKTIP